MTTTNNPEIQTGAARIEQSERVASGLSEPSGPEGASADPAVPKTHLAELTLSMFTQGASTRVRVGNPHNASELYEYAYSSADAANTAMLDAGILTREQVADMAQPAGTGIAITGITVEQLEEAGLKRKGASTL